MLTQRRDNISTALVRPTSVSADFEMLYCGSIHAVIIDSVAFYSSIRLKQKTVFPPRLPAIL
jgi:hypothetical protein